MVPDLPWFRPPRMTTPQALLYALCACAGFLVGLIVGERL